MYMLRNQLAILAIGLSYRPSCFKPSGRILNCGYSIVMYFVVEKIREMLYLLHLITALYVFIEQNSFIFIFVLVVWMA